MQLKKLFRNRKVVILCLLAMLVLPVIMLIFSNSVVEKTAKEVVFDDPALIPENKVGVVLGTAKYLSDNRINLFYKYRIEAAESLYKSGKVSKLLISGDNSRSNYNEPQLMKDDLVATGIPEGDIYLDYAGFRTLDSVVRADKIFGQQQFTVISQEFHNERAIYIARQKGLDVSGFNAQDVALRTGFRVVVREYLARVKMMLDLHVTQKQPKFLGEEIEII
ncbi:MAG: ElyC/SanA/YdcF family protein [Bacteroidota bacterium]